jgi:sugar phosphate isomerase/epimerase
MTQKLLIGVQSGDWYNEADDEASMKYASEIGLEAIEFNMDHLINPTEYVQGKRFPLCDKPLEELVAYYAPLKTASEKYNVKIAQMHAPFPIWQENDEKATDYLLQVLEKVCAVCAYVGCSMLIVHPHNTKDEQELWRANLAMYERLIPAAKKYKVTVCLENLLAMNGDEIVGGVCSSAKQTIELIDTLNEKAGEKVFGFCFDIGHANASSMDVRSYLNSLGDRVTALHIHDNNGKSDAHLIPYTQIRDQWGVELGVDWEAFLGGLKDIGYQGALIFETFRATNHLPKVVEKQALSLILGIGKYFRDKIS